MLFSPSSRFRRRIQLRISERRLLLMFGDALAVIVSVFLSLMIWAYVGDKTFSFEFLFPQTFWFFVMTILWIFLAGANDFYDLRVAADRNRSLQHLLIINAQLFVIYLVIFFISERNSLPRLFIFYYAAISFVLISLWRFLNPVLIGWASQLRRVLIIGSDESAKTIIETLQQQAQQTYEIKGIIANAESVGEIVADIPVIGTGKDLLNYVLRDNISELIVSSTGNLSGDVFQGVMDAYERGISIVPMPILYERITGRVPVEYVKNDWAVVLPMDSPLAFDPKPFIKRYLDVVLSFIGFVIFIVILPILAIVIRIDSPGNIFYTQIRVGLNGKPFRIVKLRTMIPNAEAKTGAVFAQENDPRVTRIGRFLRKTRFDEVPQLINVLRGEMSLIGPRPERPEHVRRLEEKIPFYRTRHIIRPGVTGWAQVKYNYGATDDDAIVKLQYDLYYIRHQSLWLDMNILVRTVGKMVRMGGQ